MTAVLAIVAYERKYSGKTILPCLSKVTSIAPASMSRAKARELDCPRGKPANFSASLPHSSFGNRKRDASKPRVTTAPFARLLRNFVGIARRPLSSIACLYSPINITCWAASRWELNQDREQVLFSSPRSEISNLRLSVSLASARNKSEHQSRDFSIDPHFSPPATILFHYETPVNQSYPH